jgi:2-polyprenyl-3-methyl-5-hydroxy-6-metoxy-1,4-benzoquinol methylase
MIYDTKESWSDAKSMEYHKIQWSNPKESTKKFTLDIKPWLFKSNSVLDIGCGAGAVTAYIANEHPKVNFYGSDKEKSLINYAVLMKDRFNVQNLEFFTENVYGLSRRKKYDGVILTQTILLFKNFEKPLSNIFKKIKPNWIAITGLFYDGEISIFTKVHEHKRRRKVNLNTYSINRFSEFCEENGYRIKLYEPFEIKIDLEKPSDPNSMGTYTEKIINTDGSIKRLQISGVLIHNWRTVVLEKIID